MTSIVTHHIEEDSISFKGDNLRRHVGGRNGVVGYRVEVVYWLVVEGLSEKILPFYIIFEPIGAHRTPYEL